MAAVPTSPRLRGGLIAAYIAPPVSPRARRPFPPASVPLVRLLTIPADWTSPIIERLTWKTDVLISFDRTEQRIGYRTRPRRSFEYGFLMKGHELHHAEAIIHALQGDELEVPIWTDMTRLTSGLSPGDTTVSLTTAGLDFVAGGRAVVVASDYGEALYGAADTFYELLDVNTVWSGGLTLSSPIKGTWPARSKLLPLRAGYVAPEINWGRTTAEGAKGTLTVDLVDAGWETLPALAADSYLSRDVLPWLADRSEDIQETLVRPVTRIESIGGTLQVLKRSDRPDISRDERYVITTRADILQLRAWLERCAGSRVSFWSWSGCRDLEMAQDAQAADEWLLVKSVRGRALYGDSHGGWALDASTYKRPGRRNLEIRATPTATPIRRGIVSWARVGPGTEQVVLDSAVGAAIEASKSVVSWLAQRRLESDSVEMRWVTDRHVELNMTTRSAGQ